MTIIATVIHMSASTASVYGNQLLCHQRNSW